MKKKKKEVGWSKMSTNTMVGTMKVNKVIYLDIKIHLWFYILDTCFVAHYYFHCVICHPGGGFYQNQNPVHHHHHHHQCRWEHVFLVNSWFCSFLFSGGISEIIRQFLLEYWYKSSSSCSMRLFICLRLQDSTQVSLLYSWDCWLFS